MNFNFLYKKNIYVCVIDYMMLQALKLAFLISLLKNLKALVLLSR